MPPAPVPLTAAALHVLMSASASPPPDSSFGLSMRAVAWISVGRFVGLLLATCSIWCLFRSKKKGQSLLDFFFLIFNTIFVAREFCP